MKSDHLFKPLTIFTPFSMLTPFTLRLSKGWVAAAFLVGCSNTPPQPDWQMSAKTHLEHAVDAYLSGNDRVATSEFERARAEVARTGRPDWLARVELVRCASHVASLDVAPCTGFEALRRDAAPAEQAYADYLAGRAQPKDAKLLPGAHRAVAVGAVVLPEGGDALSRLVASAVVLQTGKASPALVAQAVDAASTQGWRRPLLAWLGVQLKLAEQGGAASEADRIRRRMAVVQGKP
jgi:hypothetical protein